MAKKVICDFCGKTLNEELTYFELMLSEQEVHSHQHISTKIYRDICRDCAEEKFGEYSNEGNSN